MSDNVANIVNQFKELKLNHLAAGFEDFLSDSYGKDKPNVQFLQEALAIEIANRKKASRDKRIKIANLPTFDKSLDLNGYDFGKRQGVTRRQIIELSSNFVWIDKAYNVLFLGSPGLGKSFLACYLGYKAIEAGYKVVFVTMNNLSNLLKSESVLSRSTAAMKRIRECDLLILDEVANVVLDRQEANKMFQLICDFYQQTSLILTSNKSFGEWSRTLGDEIITTAFLDRILHKCEIFNIGGESWRMEDRQSILDDLLNVQEGETNA